MKSPFLARLAILVWAVVLLPVLLSAQKTPMWTGAVRDGNGKPVSDASIHVRDAATTAEYSTRSNERGEFSFADIARGQYQISVSAGGKTWASAAPLQIDETFAHVATIELSSTDATLRVVTETQKTIVESSGGEKLSKEKVEALPLNERDFSKLLLLAAGTMTDTNGAANFTQQFAVNGQRGVTSVFALDGADTTDPELGGATFANFNVDAIQEVQSSSGVMPAEIGHGAAGFNNVITKSGTDQVHGSAFEFIRNAAFDARNFFDHRNDLDPRRIPPFGSQ